MRVQQTIHMSPLVCLVDERALSGLEDARLEDRVNNLVCELGEAACVLRESQVLRDASECPVGLNYEELGDNGRELVKAYLE